MVRLFQREQKRNPVVLIVGAHGSLLMQTAYNAGAEYVILCDANPKHLQNILWTGVDESRVTVTKDHTLRLGSNIHVDVVILDIFTSTINRWAPVYIIRDLLKRGILNLFPDRLPYVCPTKSAMSLRVYESPTWWSEASTPSKRVKWRHAGAMTDTDLFTPVSPRVDVLYEQYNNPAQTWPQAITIECSKSDPQHLVAVLEWTVHLMPSVSMTHLVQRSFGHVDDAVRLNRVGMDHFAWADVAPVGEGRITFINTPKLTGGVNLTLDKKDGEEGFTSLPLVRMDAAIERWFGSLVQQEFEKSF